MRDRRLLALLLLFLLPAIGLVGYVVVSSADRPPGTTGDDPADDSSSPPRDVEAPPSPEDYDPDPERGEPDRSTLPDRPNRPDRPTRPGPPRRAAGGVRIVDPDSDIARIAGIFESRHDPVPVEQDSLNYHTPTPDGAVLTLPAGFHDLSLLIFSYGDRFPEDVVIQGAGMDATILRIIRNIGAASYRRLTFRDMTLDGECEQILRIHSKKARTASLRLERCRIVNFGPTAAIHAEKSLTLLATDSRFEGGYGLASSTEALFSGSAIRARLERCCLLGPVKRLTTGSGGWIALDDCESLGVADEELTRESDPPVDCAHRPYVAAEARSMRHDFLEAFTREAKELKRVHRLVEEYRLDLAEITRRGPWFDLFVTSPEGTVVREIRFPAGVHRWDPQSAQVGPNEALVVRGAGRDSTLLRLAGDMSRLDVTWRDLTLDVEKGEVVSYSTTPSRTRLERCRVIGFDRRAGPGAAFVKLRGYLFGTDSEFVAGYGRDPYRGSLFRLHEPLLARLVNCRIRITGGYFWKGRRDCALCVESSRLVDLSPKLRRQIEEMEGMDLLPETTVEYGPVKLSKADRQPRPLSDLNPEWTR